MGKNIIESAFHALLFQTAQERFSVLWKETIFHAMESDIADIFGRVGAPQEARALADKLVAAYLRVDAMAALYLEGAPVTAEAEDTMRGAIADFCTAWLRLLIAAEHAGIDTGGSAYRYAAAAAVANMPKAGAA